MKPTPQWSRAAMLNSPLFAALHPILANFNVEEFPTLQECNALLMAREPLITVQSGTPLSFVPQEYGKLAFDAQYEPRCYLKGEVPTRAYNWHDLLNALVWLTFPKTKAIINARHFHALMQNRYASMEKSDAENVMVSSQRGAVRDVNTLLDESGVIVVYSDPELAVLLRNFKWQEMFWLRRAQVRVGMGFYLFGHGLYEKALQPYVGMTGQGLLLRVEPAFFSWPRARQLAHLDDLLSDYLATPGLCCSTSELSPVPLLGVPGWAADNEYAEYYDNTAYFRSGKRP